jgi:predicted negative regulator of RcsB-dependent stress response
VLWKKRLKQAVTPQDLTRQYDLARMGCELPDWRDQAALLDLIQGRVDTEQAAEVVLSSLWSEPESRNYVARAILRRTVDPRLSAAVSRALFGARVDWAKVDRDLLDAAKPEDKLKKLREAMLAAPGDPAGDVRLVKLLAQQGNRGEALAHGRRMRDRGMMTPLLALQLGDVLSDAKEEDEARRTYSEIVEFDAESAASRRALGDVFLRHGWFPEAYRQYKTLVDIDTRAQQSWLRLAAAAAGSGRVDEAWRIERQVATGEGTPGPDDPRYWARLWSAARMGLLLEKPEPGTKDAIARRLKELSLFSGPGTLALLTWEDLDARLSLVAADDKKEQLAGEITDAGATGLVGMLTSTDGWQKGGWAARWKTAPVRDVAFKVVVLTWDEKGFSVNVRRGVVKADEKQTALLVSWSAFVRM